MNQVDRIHKRWEIITFLMKAGVVFELAEKVALDLIPIPEGADDYNLTEVESE